MNPRLAILCSIAALAIALAAPVPARAASIVGSCSIANGISCADYEDMPAQQPKEMCTKYGGKWSTAACPAAKRVGTCVQKQQPRGRILTHSYPPATAASARKACANTPGGTFQP